MPRTYEHVCGLAHALDLVGGRWSLLIVRDLLTGPKRFGELQEGLAGIPTNVLSARLKELEEGGVVQRAVLSRPASGFAYELTAYGRELQAVLAPLGMWGARTLPPPQPGDVVTAGALGLALVGAFRPEHAAGVDRRYELRIGGRSPLRVRVADGAVSVTSAAGPGSGRADGGDDAAVPVVLQGSAEALVAVLGGRRRLDDVMAAGDLEVSPTKADARRFFKLFRFPGA